MEDLPPIAVTEQNPFCLEMMKRLNIQRKQGQLCDITLITKDDQELKAHRNVLSAASPFFCKLLQSDMKENREGVVRFEEISESVMEDVLEFIYTGTVEVTQENCATNCISTFYFAEKYDCEELVSDSKSFIHENFASVAVMDEFLSLEAKEVERWISSDEIVVETEADVFQILQKWVEHDKSERKAGFEELLRHVRLDFVSRDYLLNVVTNELVRDNAGCLRLVSDTIKQTTFSSDDNLSQSPRKGLDTRAIVACGEEYAFCYVPQKDEWKGLPNRLAKKRLNILSANMIRFRDQLFMFHSLGQAERYDPVFNGWSSFSFGIFSFKVQDKVTVIGGELFSIDETVRKKNTTTTIEKFHVESCSWQEFHSSPQCYRKKSCVIGSGNFLYLLGGRSRHRSQYVAKADRFDIMEKKWEEITEMQQARGGAFGVATQEKIFVAGGANEESIVLKTCEVYNVSTNEWQLIANLNVCRTHGSMVCLGGRLYVQGGFDQTKKKPEHSVECYDSTQCKWIVKTTIPVEEDCKKKHAFKGCVLKFSQGVLDYLDDAIEEDEEDEEDGKLN
ncbi:kelch-like protein 2 [Stylophora pistillata]|uniref:kelch-like protein 2 n=1 Tax=Stylophora pistillata TaxID=50429 RepID=UPI000C04F06D|nr:kelch-like protein 2 [Stylophora pistillata]